MSLKRDVFPPWICSHLSAELQGTDLNWWKSFLLNFSLSKKHSFFVLPAFLPYSVSVFGFKAVHALKIQDVKIKKKSKVFRWQEQSWQPPLSLNWMVSRVLPCISAVSGRVESEWDFVSNSCLCSLILGLLGGNFFRIDYLSVAGEPSQTSVFFKEPSFNVLKKIYKLNNLPWRR